MEFGNSSDVNAFFFLLFFFIRTNDDGKTTKNKLIFFPPYSLINTRQWLELPLSSMSTKAEKEEKKRATSSTIHAFSVERDN
jgi:hypothetical protein